MSKQPIRTAARQSRRQRRLGPNASCIICGESDSDMLTTGRRSILQEHHVVTRACDTAFTVVVCLNHHAKLTERQRAIGVSFEPPTDALDRIINCLRSLATFFVEVARACNQWVVELERIREEVVNRTGTTSQT